MGSAGAYPCLHWVYPGQASSTFRHGVHAKSRMTRIELRNLCARTRGIRLTTITAVNYLLPDYIRAIQHLVCSSSGRVGAPCTLRPNHIALGSIPAWTLCYMSLPFSSIKEMQKSLSKNLNILQSETIRIHSVPKTKPTPLTPPPPKGLSSSFFKFIFLFFAILSLLHPTLSLSLCPF